MSSSKPTGGRNYPRGLRDAAQNLARSRAETGADVEYFLQRATQALEHVSPILADDSTPAAWRRESERIARAVAARREGAS